MDVALAGLIGAFKVNKYFGVVGSNIVKKVSISTRFSHYQNSFQVYIFKALISGKCPDSSACLPYSFYKNLKNTK